MPTNPPAAPLRCACGAAALVSDDERPGVAYCLTCWLKKYPNG
jgi:hypothetical protein